MERDTIRRLLETSARYLGLDSLAGESAGPDEAFPATADDDADDKAASTRLALACLLSGSGCARPQAMA